ncbi:MAG: class I SAM-dependent methyltransferase [Myxococcales bacterium]|nr:class I SAM-dependent methyltransferase [Myxococcales bacterium]
MITSGFHHVPVALESIAARSPISTRVARQLVLRGLAGLRHGVLDVADARGVTTFGAPATDGLHAQIRVLDERAWLRVALGGSLGLAESYIAGWLEIPSIADFVRVFARNSEALSALESGVARVGLAAARHVYRARENTLRGGSERNIAEHYDLGNDFFARMLDPTMTYSAGYFESGEATMEQGSLAKLRRLGEKLALGPSDHLLEIGTGWGSMAVFAAKTYGCRVTTTTISREQHRHAQDWVAREGLADRVTVLDVDYRHLTGRFDKAVSIEMVEAVGARFLPTYMQQVASVLRPGGSFAMQAITIGDELFDSVRDEADFIKRYIFPGSCIPSVEALVRAGKSARLQLVDLDDQTPHYARTMQLWREALAPHRAEVVATRGEAFWRMWDYYLQYCEGGFAERYIRSMQLVFDMPTSGQAI